MTDRPRLVIFDDDRQILLCLKKDFLRALLVLETKLVEVGASAAFRAAALESALRRVGGKIVRHRLLLVIDPPYNQRPIRIALQKVHHDFLRSEERRVGKECRSRWS